MVYDFEANKYLLNLIDTPVRAGAPLGITADLRLRVMSILRGRCLDHSRLARALFSLWTLPRGCRLSPFRFFTLLSKGG